MNTYVIETLFLTFTSILECATSLSVVQMYYVVMFLPFFNRADKSNPIANVKK